MNSAAAIPAMNSVLINTITASAQTAPWLILSLAFQHPAAILPYIPNPPLFDTSPG
jgi:hypothetical protein